MSGSSRRRQSGTSEPLSGTPITVSAVTTPFGQLFIAMRDQAVIASSGPQAGVADPLGWGRWRFAGMSIELDRSRHAEVRRLVQAYFAGKQRELSISLELDGREFDRLVWAAACDIPFGAAMTYGELALDVGAPGAARAVGRAMSVCPAPVFVPCHRVVGAGGKRCGDPESWERREQLRRFEVATVSKASKAPRRRGVA
ncbi:MAG: methylated-DNA--[protein]-cysteine S-methyltransferase [Dehalococcoidia bacterium]